MQIFYVTLIALEEPIHYQIEAPSFADATMLTQAFISGIRYGSPISIKYDISSITSRPTRGVDYRKGFNG